MAQISNHAALISWFEMEFKDYTDEIRIRPVFPADTVRSPDLEQDYDPEHSDLHRKSGVSIQTKRHTFFAPTEWMDQKQFEAIEALIVEIREKLAS